MLSCEDTDFWKWFTKYGDPFLNISSKRDERSQLAFQVKLPQKKITSYFTIITALHLHVLRRD